MAGMLVLVTGFILLYRVSRKQLLRQFEEREKLKARHQQELLKAAIDTQEQERERIASELHDHIGNDLQTLKLYLHQMIPAYQEGQEPPGVQLLAGTIRDVRELSHELMPASLQQLGLTEALKSLVSRLDAAGQIAVELISEGSERRTPEVELALYRIVQELINNTLRHAQASCIRVFLDSHQAGFCLTYEDDGIGLPQKQKEGPTQGLGLKNIESRCQLIGASSEFGRDNPGMKISITGY